MLKVFLVRSRAHSNHASMIQNPNHTPCCAQENVLKDAAVYAEHARRKTVTVRCHMDAQGVGVP